ncbi:cytochrome C [Oryzomonas rubra]|uniref:Cytochrome C n=1 Tax=Oryzomonas rubra TaxID=2509454 RepID=A0A5A9XDZ5_9BACT|nr:cytochrome C [Oryzomonas rubra]KAA0891327.1 cytochrome C [Oryzomonas rubra]
MKKILTVLCIGAIAALGVNSAFGGLLPQSGVNGSLHDMNYYATANGGNSQVDNQDRVCAFCHTPHHALEDSSADYLPLWSHQLTNQTFSPYQSATLNGAIIDPLAGPSRLCMSCHDGVIAVDQHYQFGGTYTISGDGFTQRAVGTGGDLTNDHPVGFSYIQARTDDNGATGNNIADPSSHFATGVTVSTTNSYNTITRGTTNKTIQDTLYNGAIMTCATCHDVHNKDNAVNAVAHDGKQYNYFVYAPQKDSALCLSCHIK